MKTVFTHELNSELSNSHPVHLSVNIENIWKFTEKVTINETEFRFNRFHEIIS